MAVSEPNLDLAIAQFVRRLDNQFGSIDSLSTKTSVLLGFVLTALVAALSFGAGVIRAQPLPFSISMGMLILAAIFLAYSYARTEYSNTPEPRWFLLLLDQPTMEVKRKLVANLAVTIEANRTTLNSRFRFLNVSIVLFLVGVVLFGIGVLLT